MKTRHSDTPTHPLKDNVVTLGDRQGTPPLGVGVPVLTPLGLAEKPSAVAMVPSPVAGGTPLPGCVPGLGNGPLEWEQQPGESDKAFGAFKLYLDAGHGRSVLGVCRELGKSRQLLQRWAGRWRWRDRAAAHAAFGASLARSAFASATVASAERWAAREEVLREQEWECREAALRLFWEALARWRKVNVKSVPIEGLARLLELASTLGHRATGRPMEIKRTEITGEGGGPVHLEVESALRRIYGPVVEVEGGSKHDGAAAPVIGEVGGVGAGPGPKLAEGAPVAIDAFRHPEGAACPVIGEGGGVGGAA